MMYKCKSCGEVCAYPYTRTENRPDADGFVEHMVYACCPYCGSAEGYTKMDVCQCGNSKGHDEPLCDECKEDLRKRFGELVESLSEPEREQLNDWLDGDYIENWGKWNE